MTTPTGRFDFEVVPTSVHHGLETADVLSLANGYEIDGERRVRHARLVAEQVERFPDGQFVAVTRVDGAERVVGTATTMRTGRPPFALPLTWGDAIGDHGLPYHDPTGAWLYGVEIAVHPAYWRRGVASALYRARLALVGALGLRGWYAGGMLMGYHRVARLMRPRAYAERVIAGDLQDPTVSMQLRRGLLAAGIIEDYYPEPKAGNCAVLLTYLPRGGGAPEGARARRAAGAGRRYSTPAG
jgi:GNAT superfamily N-acetyltransferase